MNEIAADAPDESIRTNPARREIRLRRAEDGSIQRFVQGQGWTATSLSKDMILDGEEMETLEQLLELLETDKVENLAFELRLTRQRNIGRQLYRSLFGNHALGDPGRWLHFVPEVEPPRDDVARAKNDEFVDLVCRIPWAFLTRADTDNAPFLMLDRKEPVTITIDAAPSRGYVARFQEIRFPLHPHVLLVIPQVQDPKHPTEGEAHRAELEAAFTSLDTKFEGCRLARTHARFLEQLRKSPSPDVIYFYGHAFSAGHGGQFQFENPDGSADWRDFDEISEPISVLLESFR
jgi:hypothetical protein